MVPVLFFLHFAGFAVWLGAMITLIILLLTVRKNWNKWDAKPILSFASSLIRWLNLAVLAILVSGGLLIPQLGYGSSLQPLWFKYMERGGGLALLLFIVVSIWLNKNLADKTRSSASLRNMTAISIAALSLFTVLGMSVLLVVSLRLA